LAKVIKLQLCLPDQDNNQVPRSQVPHSLLYSHVIIFLYVGWHSQPHPGYRLLSNSTVVLSMWGWWWLLFV